jgi:ABC-2 type transport system ATP-binding protein
MEEALQLQNVVKTFGSMRAVDDLQFAVRRGETCAVVGPSGAGKTTTIRMILSILFPDSGRLSVLGRASALEAKDRIGYLPEERGVYRRMKVGDFLLYIAQLKGVAPAEAHKRGERLLGQLGLEDVLGRKCDDLSKGMLQRVQFVVSVINQPELLILDEPFSGLDPVSVRLLKQVINAERARGTTVLFSTHVMSSAEELCDRVVMIHRGRKVLDEATSALRRQFDLTRIEFEALDPAADLSALRVVPGVDAVEAGSAGICMLRLQPGTDPAAAIRAAASTVAPARVELARIRLEDVFVRLVTTGDDSSESEQMLRRQLQGGAAEGVAA